MRSRPRRRFARDLTVGAVLVLAAACSGGSGVTRVSDGVDTVADEDSNAITPDPTSTDATTPATTVSDGPSIVDGVADDVVLVLDRDGGADALVAYRADGTTVTTFSDGSDGVIWQPIWSPDGRRVAWTRSADGVTWELVTAAVDGSDRTAHPLPGQPDYIAFDPSAQRVLALTPSPGGFGVVIVDVSDPGSEPFDVIDIGQPYFSDFSPGGDRLIAHVATDMRVVDLADEPRSLDLPSRGHQTPAWHPSDDEIVFFATESDDGNRLVSHRLDTGDTSELATFDAFVFFDVDPSGERVAVSAVGAVGDDGLQTVRAAPARGGAPALGGGLWLVDLVADTTTKLGDRPTSAPMWDPTGSRFVVRSSLAGTGRWTVHELDGTRTSTAERDIDDTLLPVYLPFWDQYARSQTVWSPDGGRFVHVGRAPDGESGVWIHDAGTSGPSTLVAEGDVAFWSPT